MIIPYSLPDDDEIQAEHAWVSVIQKMDEAYADLVRSQVELEEKNVELEEAKSFSDSIQSSMNDVLIVCDTHGLMQGANRAFRELTGLDESTLTGKPLIEMFAEQYHHTIKQFASRLVSEPIRDVELQLLAKDGLTPLSINGSARYNHRGRMVGMVLVGRTLGELQRAYKELNLAHAELQLAQQRLVQSEKMASLGRLVAGVAHELNNPISFVYGNMHVLQRYTEKLCHYFDAVGKGFSRQQLKEMRADMRLDKAIKDLNSLVEGTMEGADRVKEIVNDLRQFSSTQASEKAEFDIVHVIKSALHWIIKESKYPVVMKALLPDRLLAYGHSGQIHQVVVNLIQNAFDAMSESAEKQLSISASADANNTVIISFIDSGTGISEQHSQHLFEPFFTTKPVGMGTGLGLSISYGIVSEHGGELSIVNHESGGAKVTLVLPGKEHSDA